MGTRDSEFSTPPLPEEERPNRGQRAGGGQFRERRRRASGKAQPAVDQRADPGSVTGSDTKEKLMRAAEHLFARQGIDGTHIREINQLAGQRNPSAVHYHFGSREGLVQAILFRHQESVEVEAGWRLDELSTIEGASVRDLVEAMVRPLCRELETSSGRDFLRIVPPFIVELVANLRRGVTRPITSESARLLRMLEARLGHLPEVVRRERLVTYSLLLTSMLAERAGQVEARQPVSLDSEQFLVHLLDVIEAAVTAPSHIR